MSTCYMRATVLSLVAQLKANGERYHKGEIGYDVFTAQSLALWNKAESLGISDAVRSEVSRG